MFQVFQLTTLVIRSLVSRVEQLLVSLERVAIREEEVRGVLLCVEDFARSPHFTRRSFFSESGFTMLSESGAIADSITSIPVYAPWRFVESACASHVVTDLLACWERVVLRRRTAKDISERWYYAGTPRKETASKPRVRNSGRVEEGRVEYVPVALPGLGPPGPNKIRSSSSKGKRKISRIPMKLPLKFEVCSPPVSLQRRSLVED